MAIVESLGSQFLSACDDGGYMLICIGTPPPFFFLRGISRMWSGMKVCGGIGVLLDTEHGVESVGYMSRR